MIIKKSWNWEFFVCHKMHRFHYLSIFMKIISRHNTRYCIDLLKLQMPISSTHWGRVTHICISKLAIIGADYKNNYLDQCWNIINWTLRNKLQLNFNRDWYIYIQETIFEAVICRMAAILSWPHCINTLWPRQDARHFPDDIFKCIFVNENV